MKKPHKFLAILLTMGLLIGSYGAIVIAEGPTDPANGSTETTLEGDSRLSDPMPTEPERTEPQPTEPDPTDPLPTEPDPTDPPGPSGNIDISDEITVMGRMSSSFTVSAELNFDTMADGLPIVLIEVQKIWVDVPEGEFPEAEFVLYADGALAGVSNRTLTYPEDRFFWTGLDYYQADGTTKIEYEVVEVALPGYSTVVEEIESVIDSANRITPNNYLEWPVTPYLSYFIAMLTSGDGYVVWTLSHIRPDLQQQFLNEVIAKAGTDAGPFKNATLANTTWYEGAQVVIPSSTGPINVDYTIVDGMVTSRSITYEATSDWTQFIIGTHSNLRFIFTNTKVEPEDPIPITFSGRKILSGRPLLADEFEFELYKSDSEGTEGAFIESTKNLADGSFAFTTLGFEPWDEFADYPDNPSYFLVKEVQGTLPGVTYDNREFLIEINFTPPNGANWHATISNYIIVGEERGDEQSALEIYNLYEPAPVTTSIRGLKELTGRELEDDDFEFALFMSDEEGMVADDADPLQTAKNVAVNWSFPLTFDEAGIYYYVVREVSMAGADEMGGHIVYDDDEFFFEVEVWDDLEGQLMAQVTSPVDREFNNRYVLPKIEVVKMVKETEFSLAGDLLNYTFSVKNIGNAPLVKLTINDAKLGMVDRVVPLSEPLAVGETYTFSFPAPYVVTQADVTAAKPIVNTLTVTAETEEGFEAEDMDDAIVPYEAIAPYIPATGESANYYTGIGILIIGGALAILLIKRRIKA